MVPFQQQVINKTDLAQAVGADLAVMERDALKMRDGGPFVFAQVSSPLGSISWSHFVARESSSWLSQLMSSSLNENEEQKTLFLSMLSVSAWHQVKHGVGVEEIVNHIIQAWEGATGKKRHWHLSAGKWEGLV